MDGSRWPPEDDNSSDGEGQSNSIKTLAALPKIKQQGREFEITSPSPEALLAIMVVYQDELAGRLKRIEQLLLAQIPEGEVIVIIWPVTEDVQKILLPRPMITLNLINDGAKSVFWSMRKTQPDKWLELQELESRTLEGKIPQIKHVWVRCNPGETATLRVEGKY